MIYIQHRHTFSSRNISVYLNNLNLWSDVTGIYLLHDFTQLKRVWLLIEPKTKNVYRIWSAVNFGFHCLSYPSLQYLSKNQNMEELKSEVYNTALRKFIKIEVHHLSLCSSLHILKHHHHVVHIHSPCSCSSLHHTTKHRHWVGCIICCLSESENGHPNLDVKYMNIIER